MPGYEGVDAIGGVPRELRCPLCSLPMKDAVKITSCGHAFCDTCLQRFLSDGVFVCPEDRKPLDYAKIFPDAEVDKKVVSMKIVCIHCSEGCTWMDQLKMLQAHLNVCKWDAVLCPSNCSARIPRVCMEDHLASTCPKRKVKCEFCGKDYSGEQMENHGGNCGMELLHCENKCGALLQRRFLANHSRNECHRRLTKCQHCLRDFVHDTLQSHYYQCPRYPVPCPNRCDSPGRIARDEIDRHLLDSCPTAIVDCLFKHAGCGVRGPRSGVEKHVDLDSKPHLRLMCGLVKTQRQEIEDLRLQMEAMTRSADGTLLWRISNFSQLLQEARLSPNTNAEVCSVSFYTHKYGYKLVASVFPNGDGDGAEGNYLSLYVKILPGDYDNLLEWPFPHPIKFTLIDQSKHQQQHSSSSAAPSTSASPAASENGDGMKKSQQQNYQHHRQQHQQQQHVEERFDPDPNWKTFQKPRRENTASDCLGYGYPKFISHETLLSKKRGFVFEDAVFVKIEIETNSIIKN